MTGMPPTIPSELRQLMAEIGPRWGADVPKHVKLMLDHFDRLLAGAPKAGIEVRRDIAYGAHSRQKFEVYLPAGDQTGRAALLFVHGGAFVDGDRNRTAEIYANVAVNVGYRLAPEAKYPEATRDVAAVVRWVCEHAAELGVDPARVFLMGHSAGCAHVGSYAYDRRHQPADGPGIAGAIIVSGRVRADNVPENPNARKVEAYYGTDAARYEEVSPVTHVNATSVPTLIAFAEYENPLIDIYCLELAHRLGAAKRRTPPILRLKGHNHTSIIAHFNTAEDDLGREIRAFLEDPH
jgi:acetyl esterase/lipase